MTVAVFLLALLDLFNAINAVMSFHIGTFDLGLVAPWYPGLETASNPHLTCTNGSDAEHACDSSSNSGSGSGSSAGDYYHDPSLASAPGMTARQVIVTINATAYAVVVIYSSNFNILYNITLGMPISSGKA